MVITPVGGAGVNGGVVVVAVGGRQEAVAVGVPGAARKLRRRLRGAAVVRLVLLLDRVGPVGARDHEVHTGLRAVRSRHGRAARPVVARADRVHADRSRADVLPAWCPIGREEEQDGARTRAPLADVVDPRGLREVVAELERPVLLFSAGKDSIVLLRLAEKAFRPLPLPFESRGTRLIGLGLLIAQNHEEPLS